MSVEVVIWVKLCLFGKKIKKKDRNNSKKIKEDLILY